MTVHYTPGQLRSAMAIPQETYRHWRKALAPLRRGTGHSPCFTAGDLLAVAIVRALTGDFAIRVGAISAVAEALFEACNARSEEHTSEHLSPMRISYAVFCLKKINHNQNKTSL